MYRIFIAFAVLAAWVLIQSVSPAFAQNNDQGSVEVNLDVLKDIRDYQPPPMFDNKQAPLTGYGAPGSAEVKKFPMAIETRHNSMNPNFQPHRSTIAAQPVKATMSPVIDVERVPVSSLAPVLPINPESHYARVEPPIPEKKPDSIKESRIAAAPPVPAKRPAKLNASQDFIESTALEPVKVEEIPLPALEEEKALDINPAIAEETPDSKVSVEPAETSPEQPPVSPEGSKLAAFNDPSPQPVPEEAPAAPQEPETSADSVLTHAMQVLTFPFLPGSTDMDQDSRRLFDDQAVALMKGNPDIRVQVQAYATPSDDGQSSARRLSLTRAMAIRSYLIEREIDPKRIDIRALGAQSGPGQQDRVDLVFVNKNEAL